MPEFCVLKTNSDTSTTDEPEFEVVADHPSPTISDEKTVRTVGGLVIPVNSNHNVSSNQILNTGFLRSLSQKNASRPEQSLPPQTEQKLGYSFEQPVFSRSNRRFENRSRQSFTQKTHENPFYGPRSSSSQKKVDDYFAMRMRS